MFHASPREDGLELTAVRVGIQCDARDTIGRDLAVTGADIAGETGHRLGALGVADAGEHGVRAGLDDLNGRGVEISACA